MKPATKKRKRVCESKLEKKEKKCELKQEKKEKKCELKREKHKGKLTTVHQTFGWWKHESLGVALHPEKGRYLFTTRSLCAGDHILTEVPLYIGANADSVATQMVGDRRFLHLYPANQGEQMWMTKTLAKKVVDHNCWNTPIGDRDFTAMYLHMSMINHSCVPNCGFIEGSLYAMRDIAAGEELTCSYLSASKLGELSVEERKRRMKTWFPLCFCEACKAGISYPKSELKLLHDFPKGVKKRTWKDRNIEFWGSLKK